MKTLELKARNLDTDYPVFRATVYEKENDERAFEETEIGEAADYRDLKSFVDNLAHRLTRIRHTRDDGTFVDIRLFDGDDPWSSAVYALKTSMQAWAAQFGVQVAANANPMKVIERVREAKAEEAAREAREVERKAEAERKKAAAAERAAARADFESWEEDVRSSGNTSERNLSRTIYVARYHVKSFAKDLADYQDKVAKNPLNALSWSDSFVEAAAMYHVSQYVLDLFSAGASAEEITDDVMRRLLLKSAHASRSTSVMSNFTDDAERAAWAKVATRLTGRGF